MNVKTKLQLYAVFIIAQFSAINIPTSDRYVGLSCVYLLAIANMAFIGLLLEGKK